MSQIVTQNVQRIKFADLKEIQEKLRGLDKTAVELMVESIKEKGLLNFPTLCQDENGTLYIGDGAHRIQALINLGYTEADFNIDPNVYSAKEILVLQITGNIVTKKTNAKDLLRAIYVCLVGDDKKTYPEVAKMFNMSERQLHNLLSLKNFPEEIQERVGSGKNDSIPLTRAMRAIPLLGKVDEEEFIELLGRELTVAEFAIAVDSRLDEIKNGAKSTKVEGYNHKGKVRTKDEVNARMAMTEDPEHVELLKWMIGEDQATVEAGRMEWEAVEADKKIKRDAEKAKKDAEKALKGESKASGSIHLLNS